MGERILPYALGDEPFRERRRRSWSQDFSYLRWDSFSSPYRRRLRSLPSGRASFKVRTARAAKLRISTFPATGSPCATLLFDHALVGRTIFRISRSLGTLAWIDSISPQRPRPRRQSQ